MCKLKNEEGSTIVIALIFVMVITLACMSLFLAMSATSANAGKSKDREQAEILCASLSRIIQEEISEGVTIYEASADEPGVGRYVFDDSDSIGKYIMNSLGTADWTYYNPHEGDHNDLNDNRITKTFDMSQLIDRSVDAKEKFRCTVSMHWESDYNTEYAAHNDYTGRSLYVTVAVEVQGRSGNQENKMTSRFSYAKKRAIKPDNTQSDEEYYWWTYKGEME